MIGALRNRLREQPVVAKVYRSTVTPVLWHSRRRFGRRDAELRSEYFATSGLAKLQIGCGLNLLPGWLNTDHYPMSTDALRLDATKPLAFQDASFDYVYSEHMIEHITRQQADAMLGECFRIMKPGGRIRIATPDFEFLIRLYQAPDEPANRAYIDWLIEEATPDAPSSEPIYLINNFVRDWHHMFIFDRAALEEAISRAGFEDFSWHDLQESSDPHLANLANESRAPAGIVRHETMTIEAIKPRSN